MTKIVQQSSIFKGAIRECVVSLGAAELRERFSADETLAAAAHNSDHAAAAIVSRQRRRSCKSKFEKNGAKVE